MPNNVELNVRTQLSKIVEELQAIANQSDKVGENLADAGKDIGDGLNSQATRTRTFLSDLRGFSARVGKQLKDDFKSLASVNALASSLRFSEMFRGSIKETVTLSDAIRKLGGTLGIAGKAMSSFQDRMSKGLSQIGMSSEAAANALSGLSETPVRGEGNLLEYAKTAGQLASVSREQGQEGNIAGGLSKAVVARGGDVNDLAQMRAVSQDVMRIRLATGKSASEVLQAMNDLFSNANKSFKERLQGGGAVTLATAALLGGKNATAFLERYLQSNQYQRFGLESQGLGKIMGPNGQLNVGAMEKTMQEAAGRGMGDVQAGLTTFGMSDEEAQGFIRLTEAMKQNAQVIEQARTRQVDLNKSYEEGLGLSEAFRANLNKVKGLVPTGKVTQGLTNLLGESSKSTGGALAVTAGSGVLAALLASYGLKGIGKALGSGAGGIVSGAMGGVIAKQAGATPVYVVNAAEIAGMNAGISGGMGIGGALKNAGFVAATAYGSYKLAEATEPFVTGKLNKYTSGKTSEGFEGNVVERLFYKLDKLLGSPAGFSDLFDKNMRLQVELKSPELKATKKPSRGASFGP